MIYATLISVLVAIVSAIIAGCLYKRTGHAFLLSNRPYLVLIQYGVRKRNRDGDTYIEPVPHKMMYKCFKSPLKVVRGELWFDVFEDGKYKERIGSRPIGQRVILHLGLEQETILNFEGCMWAAVSKRFSQLKKNEELRQRVHLTYEWAGNNEINQTYEYTGMWKLVVVDIMLKPKLLRRYTWRLIDEDIK